MYLVHIINLLLILVSLMLNINSCNALTSHWIVTQEGKLEQKIPGTQDTFLPLKRPYDLVSFLKQEEKVSKLLQLEFQLLKQIDRLRGFEKILTTGSGLVEEKVDQFCLSSGNIHEFDLYMSTILPLDEYDNTLRSLEMISLPDSFDNYHEPECSQYHLNFSLYTFDHLQTLTSRHNQVAMSPEVQLRNSLPHRDSLSDLGQSLSAALSKNSTSWVLLNLATVYWRMKGRALQGLSCVRLALHYSPPESRDFALLNLANILHRSGNSRDAATVMITSSLNKYKMQPMSFFMLGNILSVLGFYEKAAKCYNYSSLLDDSFEMSKRRYLAALCNGNIELICEKELIRVKSKLDEYEALKNELNREWVGNMVDSNRVEKIKNYIANLNTRHELDKEFIEYLEIFDTIELNMIVHFKNMTKFSTKSNLSLSQSVSTKNDSSLNSTEDHPIRSGKPRIILRQNFKDHPPIYDPQRGREQAAKINTSNPTVNDTKSIKIENINRETQNTTYLKSSASKHNRTRTVNTPTTMSNDKSKPKNFTKPNTTNSEPTEVNNTNSTIITTTGSLPDIKTQQAGVKSEINDTRINNTNRKLNKPKQKTKKVPKTTAFKGQFNDEQINNDKNIKLDSIARPNKSNPKEVLETTVPILESPEIESDSIIDDDLTNSIESLYSEHYFYAGDIDHVIESGGSNTETKDEIDKQIESEEFPPLNPIPPEIEMKLFPRKGKKPLPDFDNPYWPKKKLCTVVLKTLDNWNRYPSTHLAPQNRGVKFRKFFDEIPFDTAIRAPLCQLIVDLPFSVYALDHLPGIMYRHTYSQLMPEPSFTETLFDAIEPRYKELQLEMSEAGTKLFDTMKYFGNNWALFILSGLYWRVVGNPYHSLECYRRAAHFAPINAKDVAWVGVANILHRNSYFVDSIIVAKMATQYNLNEPISHFTLAKILSSQGSLAASSLHLRYALHLKNDYHEALDTLKIVRCYLKFDNEKDRLEKQQVILVEQQKRLQEEDEWIKNGVIDLLSDKNRDIEDINIKKIEPPKFLVNQQNIPATDGKLFNTNNNKNNNDNNNNDIEGDHNRKVKIVNDIRDAIQLRKHKLLSLYSRGLLEQDMQEIMNDVIKLEEQYDGILEVVGKSTNHDYIDNDLAKEYNQNTKSNTAIQRLTSLSEIPFFFLHFNDRRIKIAEFIDMQPRLEESIRLPTCTSVPPGLKTFDHFEGMHFRRHVVLPNIPNIMSLLLGEFNKENIDIQPWPIYLPFRLAISSNGNQSNWVAYHLASQYWLAQGRTFKAMQCIRAALFYVPNSYKDFPLITFVNYLLLGGIIEEAMIIVDMAMNIYNNHPIYYFAKAMVFYAKGDTESFKKYLQVAENIKTRLLQG